MKSLGVCQCGKVWHLNVPDEAVSLMASAGKPIRAYCADCQVPVFDSLIHRWQPDGLHHVFPVLN